MPFEVSFHAKKKQKKLSQMTSLFHFIFFFLSLSVSTHPHLCVTFSYSNDDYMI